MKATQLELFEDYKLSINKKVINVSSVPQRSPFRYAGGKTWLIPTIREWLSSQEQKTLIEPFCGGGIVSLTAAAENLADSVAMVELDEDVSAVWEVILTDGDWLVEKILNFQMNRDNVNNILSTQPQNIKERAFATIIRNRTNHGGIMTKGAGLLKNGENGKGIGSRWYPNTLAKRIREIISYKNKITFTQGNAFDYFDERYYGENVYFFIDPPYTIAGKRLYTHNDVDHEEVLRKVSAMTCHYLVTYDKSDYILDLVNKYGLKWRTIPMTTTHHVTKEEVLISDNFEWLT